MHTLSEAKETLKRLNRSDNTRVKNELFSEFFSSVEIFVLRVQEEKDFVKDITNREKDLRKKIKKGKATPEELEEMPEIQELLKESQAIEKTLKLKKTVLKDVRLKIKSLRKLTKK